MIDPQTIHLAIRGWKTGESSPFFEDRLKLAPRELEGLLPQLAERHAQMLARTGGMIEIEFLDEPDPEQRFFRIGTDPSKMVLPVAVKLKSGQ